MATHLPSDPGGVTANFSHASALLLVRAHGTVLYGDNRHRWSRCVSKHRIQLAHQRCKNTDEEERRTIILLLFFGKYSRVGYI